MIPNQYESVNKFVDSSAGKATCWPWTGGTFSGRYGRFHLGGKAMLAHRVVYEVNFGPVPEGLFVMHKCNNKLCCNPEHLTVGTNSENQRHASASGAFAVGDTGIRGVTFDKKRGYWKASGYRFGKLYNLYTGPSFAKAVTARKLWNESADINYQLKE